MKTTYLVYKQVNGVRQLVVATPAEWDAILKENRGLPAERRRYFIKDCFADGDELDCMYIEMTAVEYGSGTAKTQLHSGSGKLVRSTQFYPWTPVCQKPDLNRYTKASPRPLISKGLLLTTF